jgi:hypothetical protein
MTIIIKRFPPIPKNYYQYRYVYDLMNDDIQSVITLQSPLVGSAPDEMYITEDKLIFGSHEVYIDDVTEIEVVEHDETDWVAIGTVSANTITGSVLAYTITTDPAVAIPIITAATFLGILIVRYTNDRPFAFVSMKTTKTEYQFGVRNQFDLATLFATVKGDFDDEMSEEYILDDNENDISQEKNLEKNESYK